jgi:hypothetical protein
MGDPLEQALHGSVDVNPPEIVGAKICKDNAVGDERPDSGEHGSGDREDGSSCAASTSKHHSNGALPTTATLPRVVQSPNVSGSTLLSYPAVLRVRE